MRDESLRLKLVLEYVFVVFFSLFLSHILPSQYVIQILLGGVDFR